MNHSIILGHLKSMQRELDLLVHSHLSPVERRQYFMARELELIDLKSQPTLPAAHSKIEILTRRLEQNPATPQHWVNRALEWQNLGQTDAAMSDFSRSLQCWAVQQEALSDGDKQQLQNVVKSMHNIHQGLTKRIVGNITSLHAITLPFVQTLS